MTDLLPRSGAIAGFPQALAPVAESPMDLVCERVSRWVPRRRHGDRVALNQEEDYRIRLPNPRYPMPAPALIRLHGSGSFHAAPAWGQVGPDSLDLALNVMAAHLPFRISDRLGAVRLGGEGAIVSRLAAELYRPFCEDFLAPMEADGGVVRAATIRNWIREREFTAATLGA